MFEAELMHRPTMPTKINIKVLGTATHMIMLRIAGDRRLTGRAIQGSRIALIFAIFVVARDEPFGRDCRSLMAAPREAAP